MYIYGAVLCGWYWKLWTMHTAVSIKHEQVNTQNVFASLSVREPVQTCSDSCKSTALKDRATGEKGPEAEFELSHWSFFPFRPILQSCGYTTIRRMHFHLYTQSPLYVCLVKNMRGSGCPQMQPDRSCMHKHMFIKQRHWFCPETCRTTPALLWLANLDTTCL